MKNMAVHWKYLNKSTKHKNSGASSDYHHQKFIENSNIYDIQNQYRILHQVVLQLLKFKKVFDDSEIPYKCRKTGKK